MNAYYDNTTFVRGTVGTIEGREQLFGDKLISFICAVVAMVCCPVAIKLEKASVSVALIFAFFGIVGGMESGAISMGFGTLLCLGAILVEFLILKSVFKKAESK